MRKLATHLSFLTLILFLTYPVLANQCREIFLFQSTVISEFPMNSINVGQASVGYEYAFYKALRDAQMDVTADVKKLTSKNKKLLVQSLLEELSFPVPVMIAPNGRVFSVDGHHDMFALAFMLGKKNKVKIRINILRDFSKENITDEDFRKIVEKNGWIYSKSIDDILDKPRSIFELTDSVERSVVGMAFIRIAKIERVPMKGKHFVPFIQFLIADYLTQNQHFLFQKQYSEKDVDTVVNLIQKDNDLRKFLREHLVKDAPIELSTFLGASS
jgi:hypothetical protein